LEDPEFTDAVTTGASAVGVFNRKPHPSAAKVYLNWLLSKEGQTSWALHTGGRNSLRLDVPVGDPATAIDPAKKYVQTATEEMNPQRQALMSLAREWIPQ
jgi:ABC-type Fe3+ transport system substrate-binding protein